MIRYLIIILGILTAGLLNAQPLSCNPTAEPSKVCQGESSQLFAYASGGSENYTYSWTSSPPGFFSTLPNPIAQPYETLTYHLTVFDGYETVEGSVTVIVDQRPVPNAGPDQMINWGTYTTLQGSASGGSGSYQYHWEPAGYLVNPDSQNPMTIQMFQTTLFNLDVTDLVTGCECSAPDNVLITITGGPLAVTAVAELNDICLGSSTQLFAYASGGAENYSYYWTSEPPGFISTEQNPVVTPVITQTFTVAVDDGYNVANSSVSIGVYPVPEIYNLSGGGVVCPNSSGIELVLDGSELDVNYELFRNSTPIGINLPGTGFPLSFGYQDQVGEYTVRGSIAGCHVQMNNVATINSLNFMDEICIISVDSLAGKNVVIWNKTADNAISLYNIYRESTTGGTYTIIGNVEHGAPGIFSDNSSNPLQRSFSYSITTIDTCGTESAMSSIHKTMHLNINAGINSYNLIWTPYEGIEYQTYFIYRRQLPDGFQVIDSVPNSIQSYSDLNPPQGVLDYVIEIRNENECNPGKSQNQYSSVFSNIISTNVGVNDMDLLSNIYFIHPNPAKEFLRIASITKIESLIEVAIYDLQGRVVIQDRFKSETSLLIDVLMPGIYILVISQDNKTHYQRIVKL